MQGVSAALKNSPWVCVSLRQYEVLSVRGFFFVLMQFLVY